MANSERLVIRLDTEDRDTEDNARKGLSTIRRAEKAGATAGRGSDNAISRKQRGAVMASVFASGFGARGQRSGSTSALARSEQQTLGAGTSVDDPLQTKTDA